MIGFFVRGGGPKWVLFLLASGAVFLLCGPASGQPGDGAILLLARPVHDDREPIARALPGAIDETSFVRAGARARWLTELSQLRAVDASIASARRAMASLGEAEALRELAAGERTLLSVLTLPGAATFYAELQLQLGVSAAQLGQSGLAQAAFARAARVDPSRRLLAGEAAPEIVALATQAFEAAERAPEGEVRIVVNAPGARVFLDDRERGSAPLALRARSGPHVLRIEAPGHVPYASLFEIGAGQRPEQRISLAADPRAVALHDARALLARGQAADVARAAQRVLAAAPELRALLVREARDLWIWCERGGCRAPLTARHADVSALPREPLSASNLERARAWLRTPPLGADAEHAAPASVWQRWYVWTAVSAAVIGGVVLAAVAAQADPERRLRVSVDPSALD